MKTKFFGTLCVLATMLMAFACTTPTPENEEPVLEVAPLSVECDSEEQTNSVGVTCNGDWTAESSAEWLVLAVTSGTGEGIVDFSLTENTGAEAREAQIEFVSGELTATCYVTQDAADFRVDNSPINFTFEESTASVNVFSANTWSAETEAEWLTLEYEAEAGVESALTIKAEANNTLSSRSADVVIKTKGATAKIKVTQAKLSSDTFMLFLEDEAYDPATQTLTTGIFGDSYTLNVVAPSSSVIWDAVMSYKDTDEFVVLDNNLAQTGTKEVSISLPVNKTGAPREGVLTISGKYKGNKVEQKITVVQEYLDVTYVDKFDVAAEGAAIDLALSIEPELEVAYTTDADWLVVDEKGKYTVTPNASLEERTATINMALAEDAEIFVGTATVTQPALYTIVVPFQCNTYVTPQDPTIKSSPSFHYRIISDLSVQPDGSLKTGGNMITTRAWTTSYIKSTAYTPHQLSFFFRTEHTGELKFGMETLLENDKEQIADTAYVDVEIGSERKRVMVTGNTLHWQHVGSFNIEKAGYVRVNIIPVEATGKYLPYISNFLLGGEGINFAKKKIRRKGDNVDITFVTYDEVQASDPHWIRRGPSTHLGYEQPANTEWFYNEIYVDKGYDISGSFYMTTGGSAFYMGLQPTDGGRTVLFSVWDTNTDLGWKAQVVRYGANKPNNFGHEGSGIQTFLKYDWKAETTYATLVHVRPEVVDGAQTGSTLYTGYFWSEADGWQIVAEYRRPHEVAYYRGAHSFCENFSPDRGWIPRKVNFTNQWMRDKDGVWHEVLRARLTTDGCGSDGLRKDFGAGFDEERNFLYLTNIGYIDTYIPYGTWVERKPSGKPHPEIPYEKLATMGTWYDGN